MKIVFLLQDTGQIYGAERATIDLARGLHARGCETTVLLIEESRLGQEDSKLRTTLLEAGLPVTSLPTAARFSLALARRIRAEVDRLGARVLHSSGYKADIHAWLALRGSRIAHVSTVHGWLNRPDPKERFYGWLNVQALQRCRRVIVLSRYYEVLLRARGLEQVERIPTGMDLATTRPAGPRSGPFTLGLLGRLSWEKNHPMFLAACARVRDTRPDVRFLLSGDGPLQAEIAQEVQRLGLQEVVERTGYLATEVFFARVDALVLCSRIENLPLVAMEAMARGIPVLATRVGGIPDLVEDGRTGRLVALDDVNALAAAMREVADSPATGETWGKAGREKLAREFSHADWITRHQALYGSLDRRP